MLREAIDALERQEFLRGLSEVQCLRGDPAAWEQHVLERSKGRVGSIWRAEVYDVDLGRPCHHEPAFRRPDVVVSVDLLDGGPGGLVGPHLLRPLRVVSVDRVSLRRGMVGPDQMRAIGQPLRFVLDL